MLWTVPEVFVFYVLSGIFTVVFCPGLWYDGKDDQPEKRRNDHEIH